MSKVIKKSDADHCDPVHLQELQRGSKTPLRRDKEYVFERTGFLGGMEACNIRMTPQEVMAKAKNRADEIAKEAYNKGFEQGERAGFEVGNKKAESFVQEFFVQLQEIQSIRDELLLQSEQEAVRLAMRIAGKVICREVSLNQDIILDVARESLKLISGEDRIQILLHPEDLAFLEKSKEDLMQSVQGLAGITLEQDETIRRGGCLVKTRLGEVDARIDEKIELIFSEIEKRMETSAQEKEPDIQEDQEDA